MAADAVRTLQVDHPAIHEPVQGDRQVQEVVDRGTDVLEFVRVEEVERVVEYDVVGVGARSNR